MGPRGEPGSFTRGPNGKNGNEALLSTLQKNQVIDALYGSVSMDQLMNISDNIISGTIHCPVVMGKENAIANGIIDRGNGQFSVNCTYVNLIYPDAYYRPQKSIKLNEYFINDVNSYSTSFDFYSIDSQRRISNGAQGVSGFTGPRGLIGITGPKGYQGKPGPTGPMGIDGSQGPIGPMGERGQNGLAGENGLDGDTGPTGPDGDKGPIGKQGAVGPSYIGPQGFSGYTGFVTVDFTKCKPIIESNVLTFNCPADSWLTSIKNNNGKFSGLCCPLLIGDNEEPTTFDIGLDGRRYPLPNTRMIEKAYDENSLNYKYNIFGDYYISNNDQNVKNEDKKNVTIEMAQTQLIDDVIFFARKAELI
jgi:hypothetical protein